ncbi:molybdopterin-dependent oxidoreductase [Salinirubellus salinus]|uniref:Molybdopterin-dependent oxidoreductase n=1 Tax=Salinirubellus salinus TaxID=1364945 RepID=A0A9E7QZL2_9EURY|nr:molybdopterin-dependent oxidoreductase [Salinirubellus salinus]UWM52946.1 molybdopterin-dependent oxidoreductase [Salinirubellus salinus]
MSTATRLRGVVPLALLALLAGVAGVAGSYAAAGFTPAFAVAPIESAVARVTPGALVTFAITVLGSLGQQLALLGAVALTAVLFAALSLAGLVTGRNVAATLDRPAVSLVGALLAGLAVWTASALLTGSLVESLGAGLGVAVLLTVAEAARLVDPTATDAERRSVLTGLAGAVGVVGLGFLLGRRVDANRSPGEVAVTGEPARLLADAEAKSLDVQGIEPLVSRRFYQVDINSVDPTVAPEEWSLRVTGAVDEERTFDYADVTARESHEEFVTLRCVGEKLNGTKMDNALWTVTDIMPFVEEAGLPDGPCCVMLRAADGFYEEFPLEALRDGLLAYRMNGRPLPRGHGAPVRALIPGHWGEINVKWLTEIEILEQEVDGYWEERGWHGTGPVKPVAKLHAVNTLADGRTEVAGHAYAGLAGVSRVEVSVDGGATWTDADLSERLPGTDVWRQWVHRYESPGREHEVVVRMYDDEGRMQGEEPTGPYPDGPAGWVRQTVR